jgi:crotonobetainyl-CoA:carnitine CoA-transferase CaiB-like acyl-CoA transferase
MKPLSGCRVLDMGIITAGAAASALLADLGAEVIKVESPNYRDPFRHWSAESAGDEGPQMPPLFRATNRNKTGISVDLKDPQGYRVFARLVERSDIVVENFRRGALERLGLSYERLRALNPNIILASISSQGETGPEARYVSFGSTLEAVGGLAWLTGYRGGAPVVSGVDLNYPDQVVAIFAAGMIATAWYARRSGQGGVHLDISQRELTTFLLGEAFATASQADLPRSGNDQAPHLVQDCFRSRDEQWIAVTVDVDDLERLHGLVGMRWPAYDIEQARARLTAWITQCDGAVALAGLQSARIAAATVLNGEQVFANWCQRPDFALVRSPDGEVAKGFPFQLDGAALAVTRNAPDLGADTHDVLTRVAGYSDAEIAALQRNGIVETGTVPTAASS